MRRRQHEREVLAALAHEQQLRERCDVRFLCLHTRAHWMLPPP